MRLVAVVVGSSGGGGSSGVAFVMVVAGVTSGVVVGVGGSWGWWSGGGGGDGGGDSFAQDTTVTGPQEKTLRGLIRQGRVSPAPVRVELAYKQFVQVRLLHNAIKWQHGGSLCQLFPARLYTAARESHLQLVPSKA